MWAPKTVINGKRVIAAVMICGMMASLALGCVGNIPAHADDKSWFDEDALQLDILNDNVSLADLPIRRGNLACAPRALVTKPQKILPVWPYYQKQQTTSGCVIESRYGLTDESGYLQRTNTGMAGRIKQFDGVNAVVTPVPGSDDLILHSSSGASYATSYYYVYRNVEDYLKTIVNTDGTIVHELTRQPTEAIRDTNGKLAGINTESLSFSRTSKWMVADIPGIGLSRIDVESMHIQPFARFPIGYGSGTQPGWKTAVSPTGRYVAVASTEHTIFRLYDVNTCTRDVLALYEHCQYVDLWQLMKEKIPHHLGVSRLTFMSDDDLDFYGSRLLEGQRVYSHYSLHPPGHVSGFDYVGLGDSFSSGEGAYEYRDGTDMPDNRCHLSARSYPYVIGSGLELGSYESVACSGAKLHNLRDNSEEPQAKLTNDLTSKQIINSWLPGYLPQKTFIDQYKPKVITLTAGGNDIGFSDIVKRCISYDTCYQYKEERKQLLRLIDSTFEDLVTLYAELQQAGGHDRMRVYVLGYPQLVDPEGNCALNVHLNKGELYFANELVTYLNSVIKLAAQKAGVYYVDVEKALEGHRLCETESSNVAVNGLTAGNTIPSWMHSLGPIGQESYHPNAFGHKLLAKSLQTQTNDLSLPMPTSDASLELSYEHDGLSMIQNALSAAPGHATQFYGHLLTPYHNAPSLLQKGRPTTLATLDRSDGIAPNGTYSVELHSNPVELGRFTADAMGDLAMTITLPATVPSGVHTLHVYGSNLAGQNIDLFKTVVVTDQSIVGSARCVVVVNAGVDADKDGIDDGCDPIIGKQPQAISLSSDRQDGTIQTTNDHPLNESEVPIRPDVEGYAAPPMLHHEQSPSPQPISAQATLGLAATTHQAAKTRWFTVAGAGLTVGAVGAAGWFYRRRKRHERAGF